MGDDGTGDQRRDSRAGSESTLIKLYRDVPAAEEYDLVERSELDEERRRQAAWLDEDDSDS